MLVYTAPAPVCARFRLPERDGAGAIIYAATLVCVPLRACLVCVSLRRRRPSHLVGSTAPRAHDGKPFPSCGDSSCHSAASRPAGSSASLRSASPVLREFSLLRGVALLLRRAEHGSGIRSEERSPPPIPAANQPASEEEEDGGEREVRPLGRVSRSPLMEAPRQRAAPATQRARRRIL